MHFNTATFLFALSTLSTASAAAINVRETGIDYSAPITTPESRAVWVAGLNHTVTWNTTLPTGITQDQVAQTATIKLGYLTEDSENLEWTLAENVPLYTTGSYEITLPSDLEGMSNYVIALLGSSGNISPEFTIVQLLVPEGAQQKRERKTLFMDLE